MTQSAVHDAADSGPRNVGLAMRRGFMERCPKCGKGRMFRAFLKVADACPVCHEDLSHQRADDAPPYITMLVVGHIVVAGVMAADEIWPNSPLWLDALIWLWITFVLSMLLLPRVKGALVGYQWALRMHGFGGPEEAT
jgi:uncharacterized protein (DUF983 family)